MGSNGLPQLFGCVLTNIRTAMWSSALSFLSYPSLRFSPGFFSPEPWPVSRTRTETVFLLAVAFALAPTAVAQDRPAPPDSLEITAQETRAHITDGCGVWRQYRASLERLETNEDTTQFKREFQDVTGKIGSGSRYNLTSFSFEEGGTGISYVRPLPAVSLLPEAAAAADRGAEYASIRMADDGSNSLSYLEIKDDGSYEHGSVRMTRLDTKKQTYEPPRLGLKYPLRKGVRWTVQNGQNSSRPFRIVGSGTLVTPDDTLTTLIRRSELSLNENTIRYYSFFPTAPENQEIMAHLQIGPRASRVVRYYARTKITPPSAPEGSVTHCASLDGLPVSFPLSQEWTVASLHGVRPATHAINIMRDTAAVGEFGSENTSISTGATINLGTRDNVIVMLAVFGMDDAAKDYVDRVRLGSLDRTEVIQPVTKRRVSGRTAFEKRWRGIGSNGEPIVSRKIAFRAADRLVEASVLHPPKMPDDAKNAVQVLLNHLTVHPQ